MTNTSPLEVHYKWYFLRHPPVRRQDPEQCDEGVDMQSECETDSLTEEGLESQDGGEEESESEDESQDAEIESDGEVEREDALLVDEEERDSVEQKEEKITEESTQERQEYDRNISQASSRSQSSSPRGSEPVTDDQKADISSDSVPVTKEHIPSKAGREKQPWELVDDPFTLVRIEQVFDILPLHGTLLPGESQEMQFTFYGYADIATECMAACKVDGGPTYRLRLRGEASNVQYKFSHKTIDFGKQVHEFVHILMNVHLKT